MQANIVDLRYKMKDVLKALDRQENVQILYRGKTKGTITPANTPSSEKISTHPFFGSTSSSELSVGEEMNELRKERYHDL